MSGHFAMCPLPPPTESSLDWWQKGSYPNTEKVAIGHTSDVRLSKEGGKTYKGVVGTDLSEIRLCDAEEA